MDQGEKVWCPGRSPSSGRWALYILTPIACAAGIFACLHYRRHGSLGRIRLPDASSSATAQTARIFAHPLITKIVAAAVVIPVAIIGLLSRIPVPRSWPEIIDFSRNNSIRSWLSRRRRRSRGYSPLGQDENNATDVLLDDYDGSEAQLLDEVEEDAEEF